jgi:hypothetical protein
MFWPNAPVPTWAALQGGPSMGLRADRDRYRRPREEECEAEADQEQTADEPDLSGIRAYDKSP